MVNPNNIIALDDIRRIIKGVMIEPVVTTEEDFKKFMSTTYSQLMKKEEDKSATGITSSTTPVASPPVSLEAIHFLRVLCG